MRDRAIARWNRAPWHELHGDHYVNYARTELILFDKPVTDWERMRYSERG